MGWSFLFYQSARGDKPVEDFLDMLSSKVANKIGSYLDLLTQMGPQLREPYAKKLDNNPGLWELRPGQYRLFYTFLSDQRILLAHAIIKKTQKTPKQDLSLAIKRIKEYL